ncbi:MAG: AIPR family protein [Candidatus Caenarcaniphilales bacterium]|nr:AIPR family protein [Candidatus Caenarcaniphilales bacterium]
MPITLDQIESTFSQLKRRYEGRKEDYFAPLWLAKEFKKPIDEVVEYCSFGGDDFGIDAYFVDREARNIHLYQFKWSENHELFKDSYQRLIADGMDKIFGDSLQNSRTNPLIHRMKSDLLKHRDIINKVFFYFVFNGDSKKPEDSTVLENLREDLESKKYLVDRFFEGRNVIMTIQYISNCNRTINTIANVKKSNSYDIRFRGAKEAKRTQNKEALHLGFISIGDLYRMYSAMNQKLFERNIRSGLSPHLSPNIAIKKSLKEIVVSKNLDPDYFSFHHNGVTIYAEEIEFYDSEKATLHEPRILNGAQTIHTLNHFVTKDLIVHPDHEKFMKVLDEIEVIARIVTDCKKDFVTKITISNNKQNPVEPWNLRANDLIQLELEDKFKKDGFFYERQEKAFENLHDSDLDDLGIHETRKQIKMLLFAQTILVLKGHVDKISQMRKIFETDSLYEEIFNKRLLSFDNKNLILAYNSQFRISSVIREIENINREKFYFIRKAVKSLVWSLVLQGVFNDQRRLQSLLENYGTSLALPVDFSEYLKTLGVKKIKPILADLIKGEKYAKSLKESKLDCFKTKTAFDDSMDIAYEKFGWQIASLKKIDFSS